MIYYYSIENDERESANRHSVLLTTGTKTFPIQMRSSYTAVGVIVTLSITSVNADMRKIREI